MLILTSAFCRVKLRRARGLRLNKREEVLVDFAALEHEVDAKEGGGEEVEDVREPVGKGVEEVAGGSGEGFLRTLRGGVDTEAVGERKLLDLGDELRDAGGGVRDELAEIAGDGRKGDPEEEHERRTRRRR